MNKYKDKISDGIEEEIWKSIWWIVSVFILMFYSVRTSSNNDLEKSFNLRKNTGECYNLWGCHDNVTMNADCNETLKRANKKKTFKIVLMYLSYKLKKLKIFLFCVWKYCW